MRIIPVPLTELTAQTFAPYGRVLEPHTSTPTKEGAGWVCFSDIDRLHPDVPLMVGKVFCTAIPNTIDSLEGHTSREELLWATSKDLIMIVAEPDDLDKVDRRPSYLKMSAFHIKAGQAVVIGKGTWHSPAFSYGGEEAEYYFLVEAKKDSIDQDDSPWIPFKEEVAIAVIR